MNRMFIFGVFFGGDLAWAVDFAFEGKPWGVLLMCLAAGWMAFCCFTFKAQAGKE